MIMSQDWAFIPNDNETTIHYLPLVWFIRRPIGSLQPVVRIVEFGAALDTVDLPGSLAVSRQDLIDEPAVDTGFY